jgi:hypothetical protein
VDLVMEEKPLSTCHIYNIAQKNENANEKMKKVRKKRKRRGI